MRAASDWAPLDDPATWQALYGTRVSGCRVEPLAGGNSPSTLSRVFLLGHELPATVVVKQSRAPWSQLDPLGFRREAWVYQQFLNSTHSVAPSLLHADEATDGVRLVLEDLQPAFDFRPRGHRWTVDEVALATDVLARLHAGTHDDAALDNAALMPAPDVRWPASRLLTAAEGLDHWSHDHGSSDRRRPWRFSAALRKVLMRYPPGSGTAACRCLAHSDFNTGNFALCDADPPSARLLDWHIAAGGTPGFDLGNLLFQPWNNHANMDVMALLDSYDDSRQRLGLDRWYAHDRTEAFAYSVTWCALSYLPPIAAHLQATAELSGWWLNTARAAHDAITHYAEEADAQ